jgi:hypothetical protein
MVFRCPQIFLLINSNILCKMSFMSPKAKKVMNDTLSLPREVRAFLAEKLLESLDFEESFQLSDQWLNEIEKRCRQIDESSVDLIPGKQALHEAGKTL